MPYELKTEKFSGPLEKLLELIEAEKMEISEVSMARVTDDFFRYLEKFRAGGGEGEERFRVDLRILADFISVASKLIFLKSKYLLPGLALPADEEADIKELEGRLKRYQSLKPALAALQTLWRTSHRSYSRPYFLDRGMGGAGTAVFYPGKNLDRDGLHGALLKIFDTVQAYAFETETIREKIITLEEKISEVIGRIGREGNMRFRHLSGEKSRSEMVVLFLAILHLAREQLVILEQMENFSDIIVKQNGPHAPLAAPASPPHNG